MKPNDKAELYLINLVQHSEECPDCGYAEVSIEFYPSDDERHDPDLLYFQCKCDNSNCLKSWIEVYRFVGVQVGTAFGDHHGEAWVDNLKTIFVSIVNMELLTACMKSLELMKKVEEILIPDWGESPVIKKHINDLKELIDKAKGDKYAKPSEQE